MQVTPIKQRTWNNGSQGKGHTFRSVPSNTTDEDFSTTVKKEKG